MIAEYAVLPSVFDPGAYSSPDVCECCLQNLKGPLFSEALVRDLRAGGWLGYLRGSDHRWHPKAKELLRKLRDRRRLRPVPAALDRPPGNDSEWCEEALASHSVEAMDGIVADPATASALSARPLVASVTRLHSADWWREGRGPSRRVARNTEAYHSALRLLLRHANSLMFIDPHLDPSKPRYSEFGQLLQACLREDGSQPRIEIHRVCYEGSGRGRILYARDVWVSRFSELGGQLERIGLAAEVFIWNDAHDRYLLTDLMGLLLGNGLDVSGDPDGRTTWSRLSRRDADDVQREFDPDAGIRILKHQFTIGIPDGCG